MITQFQKYCLLFIVFFVHTASQVSAQLSGNYTIDALKAASATNYKDFGSALSDMVSGSRSDGGSANGKGLKGSVTFKVADGFYYGQLRFPAGINANTGAGGYYTIVFESASGDSSKVILDDTLSHTPGGTNDYLLAFDGASQIRFSGISLTRSHGGKIVVLKNHASHISFTGNVFHSASRYSQLVTDDHKSGSFNSFSGNRFYHCDTAISLYGEPSRHDTGYIISHNVFQNVSNTINIKYHDSLVVTGNRITGIMDTSAIAISVINSAGPVTLKNNVIDLHGIHYLTGLQIIGNSGDSLRPILAADNMISLHNPAPLGSMSGIITGYNTSAYIVYNTVFNDSSVNAASYPFLVINSYSSDTRILNNAFVNNQGKCDVYMVDNSNNSDLFDYNSFYSTGDTYHWDVQYFPLAYMSANTQYEIHSISVKPVFKNDSDLHVDGYQLNGKGIPFSRVKDDIDGEPRDSLTPDIGADEWLVKNDLAVTTLASFPDRICAGAVYPIKALFRNAGTASQQGFEVKADFNGPIHKQLTYTESSKIVHDASDSIIWPGGISLKDTGLYTLTIYTSLSTDQNYTNDSLIYRIRVVAATKPVFYADTACVGALINFHNTTPDSSADYSWSFGDGDSSVIKNPSHAYFHDSAFKVVLKIRDGSGCTDTAARIISPYALPHATFKYVISTGGVVQFTPDDTIYQNYNWNFGDSGLSRLKNPEHTYALPATYQVSLTVIRSHGCADSTFEPVKITFVSVAPQSSTVAGLTVYPNPFSSGTRIEYVLDKAGPVQADLYDATGKLILHLDNGMNPAGQHNIYLDLRQMSLHPGLYYLKFIAGAQEENVPLMYVRD